MYNLSYHCTGLRIPKLQSMEGLKASHVSRALVRCVLSTRVIPDVVRTDRGPEMTSMVNSEFLSILGITHRMGAAFTPRHQGPGERAHQTIMNSHLLLMNEVCNTFPQEWAAMMPVLEYLCETAPRKPHGLSAFDLTQCASYGFVPTICSLYSSRRHAGDRDRPAACSHVYTTSWSLQSGYRRRGDQDNGGA